MLEQSSDLSIRNSRPSDLPKVIKLLEQAHLPKDGVSDQFENFLILENSSQNLIGCAGLELYEQFGLIRSVVIQPDLRNKNYGAKLVLELEQFGKNKELESLYLLTETAQRFFSKHGYTVVDRPQVPKEIQDSYEYSTACKVSAVVMTKKL